MSKPIKHRGQWRIRWTDENGRRRSEVYKDRKHASFMLESHQHRVKQVRLGLRTGIIPDRTFGDLCDLWLDTYAPEKRSVRHINSIIDCHLRPVFGEMNLGSITSEHIQSFRMSRQHLAKKTVANHLILLRSMLREAKEIRWLAETPKVKVPKSKRDEQDFSYLRTEDEVRQFLAAAAEEGEHVRIFYLTAIYTGMRAGELAALQRGDIDLDAGLITIQRSFEGPTKSNEVRRVPIFDVLRPALKRWLLRAGATALVFPNGRGKMHAPSARVYQEVLHRVLERAGFPSNTRNKRRRRYIVFHDLRHTFASHFVMNGGDIYKLQKLLGHKSIEMTQRYAHLAPDAFASDLALFGDGEFDRSEVVKLSDAENKNNKGNHQYRRKVG